MRHSLERMVLAGVKTTTTYSHSTSLEKEIDEGKVEVQVIDGLTIENRVKENKAIPEFKQLAAERRELREASLALGATQWETISRVVIPASLSGICTAVILGMSRAIGETMVVLMVAGGAAAIPESIFDACRPMPASIAAEMAEAPFRGDHYHALFATGIVLFFMTLALNIISQQIVRRFREEYE